jgi:hypothetical protein
MLAFVIEALSMDKDSSRTFLSLFVAVIWGLILGSFAESTGPWLIALFGPPVALLLSAKRPILSWQTPLVAAAISATILNRDRGDTGSGGPADTFSSLLLIGFFNWLMFTLFSCPWGFIFQRRAKKAKEQEQPSNAPEVTPARVGTVLLVFLACGVVLAGAIAAVWPITSSAKASTADHFYGLLIATGGVALTVVTYRLAFKLGIADSVKQVLDLALILAAVSCGFFFVGDFLPGSHSAPGPSLAQSLLDDGVWCLLTAIEAVAGLILLTRAKSRLGSLTPESS